MPLNQPIAKKDWEGLRVWILGASGGIGTALAVAMAQQGARVALSGRRADALSKTANACKAARAHHAPLTLAFDINDTADIEQAQREIKSQMGGVDLVVINAGTYQSTRASELTVEQINQTLSTNLLSPMRATTVILPSLLESLAACINGAPKGIAFVASVAGYRGLPRALTYGPGKAGLISFAETLWQDLNPVGLNVWVINPGFVKSRLTDRNDFEMPALIDAETAAHEIMKGFSRGQFEIHFPKRFTRFMKLLRLLPINWYLRLVSRLVPPLVLADFASNANHQEIPK